MYENTTELEKALFDFQNKVSIIVSLEMGGKIDQAQAYSEIKTEFKKLKGIKKHEGVVDEAG